MYFILVIFPVLCFCRLDGYALGYSVMYCRLCSVDVIDIQNYDYHTGAQIHIGDHIHTQTQGIIFCSTDIEELHIYIKTLYKM